MTSQVDLIAAVIARLPDRSLTEPERIHSTYGVADLLWLAGHLLGRTGPRSAEAGGEPDAVQRATAGRGKAEPTVSPEPAGRAEPFVPTPAGPQAPPDGPGRTDVHLVDAAPDRGVRSRRATALPAEAADFGLTESTALRHALRPVKRRAPHPYRVLLDEAATAQRSAEADDLFPVLRPDSERWLELAFVVDAGPSMALWQRTADELRTLLEGHGAFRDVRTWALDSGTAELRGYRRAVDGRPAAVHRPAELIDPRGRRLVLVYTDGVGAAWADGRMAGELARWAAVGPVAVIHALPSWLWERSHIATEAVWWSAWPGPGRLAATPSSGLAGSLPHESVHPVPVPVPVPVLELSEGWIGPWAGLLGNPAAGRIGGARLLPRTLGPPRPAPARPDARNARELVRLFRATSTPAAFTLAACLTVVPLTLSTMRFVKRYVVPAANDEHLAEVFLSGLIVRTTEPVPGEDPETVFYEFRPGVRDLLYRTVTRGELFAVFTALDGAPPRITAAFDQKPGPRMLVPDDDGPTKLNPDNRPFAEIAAADLRALGGEYAALAARVVATISGDPADSVEVPAPPRPEDERPLPIFRLEPELAEPVPRPRPSLLRRLLALGWRRNRVASAGGGRPLTDRFGGNCPVCGTRLGVGVGWDHRSARFEAPPSLRLEIGPPDTAGRHPWRITVLQANYRIYSSAPAFVEEEVDQVYLLCSDGHLFGASLPEPWIDRWNMVVTVGAPAGGKTYLLLRTLNQNLINPENPEPTGQLRLHRLSELEELPLRIRSDGYTRTRETGQPIEPTYLDDGAKPAGILDRELPAAMDAIRDLIRQTVVDGDEQARWWGTGFRQPLVARIDRVPATPARTRLTWIGVADLPGDLFEPDASVDPRERLRVAAYDALLWVVDPAVTDALDRFVRDVLTPRSDYARVLDGSLRPGSAADRSHRERIQFEIGRSVRLVTGTAAPGTAARCGPPRILVAITKCDLVHAALGRRGLTELGRPDAVRDGVRDYLAHAKRRWAAGEVIGDRQSEALFGYLLGAFSTDEHVRSQRVDQVADSLLAHYSAPAAFWNLVHGGRADRVPLLERNPVTTLPGQIDVVSVGAHLDRSAAHGTAGRLMVRDLVLSALGCGVGYGLGYGDALGDLLRQVNREVRVYLCSALATVPVARDDTAGGAPRPPSLTPLVDGVEFPTVGERSAALTQLLLAILGGAP